MHILLCQCICTINLVKGRQLEKHHPYNRFWTKKIIPQKIKCDRLTAVSSLLALFAGGSSSLLELSLISRIDFLAWSGFGL